MNSLSKNSGIVGPRSQSAVESPRQKGGDFSSPPKRGANKAFLIFRALLVWGFLFPVQGANAEAIWVYIQSQYQHAENEVVLSWDVLKADEPEFVVERSVNGAENFQPIGKVNYRHSGRGEFVFVDKMLPLEGCAVYYRILLMNEGLPMGSSELAVVRVEGSKRLFTNAWRVFPNPITHNKVRISPVETQNLEEEGLRLLIFDQYNSRWEIGANTVLEMNIRVENLLPELPKGLLIFQIEKGSEMERIKVINR